MTQEHDGFTGRHTHSEIKDNHNSSREIKNEDETNTPKKKNSGGKKAKVANEKRVVLDFRGEERVINKRHRLRRVEIEILEAEYLMDPTWSLKQSKALAEKLKISQTKVYKWGYERKKKDSRTDLSDLAAAVSFKS